MPSTSVVAAHTFQSKKVTQALVRTVLTEIANMGHALAVLKSDTEPVVAALASGIRDMRIHPNITEESPEYEPQANGRAERCVQTTKRQLCTLRGALESRNQSARRHPMLTWALRHAASIHSRYLVGTDGRTQWDRFEGKRSE